MATKIERVRAHLGALRNTTTVSDALIARVADAHARLDGIEPTTLTTAQKLDLILLKARQLHIEAVKAAEGDALATAAVASNNAAVDSEFTEAT